METGFLLSERSINLFRPSSTFFVFLVLFRIVTTVAVAAVNSGIGVGVNLPHDDPPTTNPCQVLAANHTIIIKSCEGIITGYNKDT